MVVFTEEGVFVRRIGRESVTNFPNGIDISGETLQLLESTMDLLDLWIFVLHTLRLYL